MSASLPKPPEPMRLPRLSPWPRWRRNLERLYRLLGFKVLGVLAIVLLGCLLWLDGTLAELAGQRKLHGRAAADLAEIKTLAEQKKRIEQGLRDSQPEHAAMLQNALQGATAEAAQAAWQQEWLSQLSSQGISDATAQPGSISRGQPSQLGLTLTFSAIPQQLLTIHQLVNSSGRLQRMTRIDINAADGVARQQFRVQLELAALYFPPKVDNRPGKPLKAALPAGSKMP